MSFLDSILVSLFCMALVFLVLAILYAIVLGFSKIVGRIQKKTPGKPAEIELASLASGADESQTSPGISVGELKLVGVDDKTAAMIMAIVSHETSIPLSELCFKSIKAIEQS